MDNIKNRIEKLRLLKRHYDIQYWKNNYTEQSDEIYDQLVKEFNELLEKNPQFKIKEDDQLESIYMNTFSEVKHKNKMLSLGKVLNIEEFIQWFNNIKRFSKDELIFEAKIDGFAICLEYDNGILIRASTRGDGEVGDDITSTIFQIPDIPNKLTSDFTGEISGEIYMKQSSLNQLNERMSENNLEPLKNVRNAAAGIARQIDSSNNMGQYLSFLCYKLFNENGKNNTYIEDIQQAKNMGFNTVFDNLNGIRENISKLNNETIEKILVDFNNLRDKIDLEIDGVVIKLNSKNTQKLLGEKNKIPNWAIAYKFPPIEKITKLLDVEWDLGVKDGRLTPMAIIEPVEIGGTLVKRPTLHNWDRINELDIKIGDTIKVSRRGDVIPHVEQVLKQLRPDNFKNIELPICPVCGSKSKIDGTYVKCINKDCKGKVSGKLNVFIRSMDIECLGPKMIDKLISECNINNIYELFLLKKGDLSNLDRLGEKLEDKILKNIKDSINKPLWRVLAGLSIPMVGETTGKLLEKELKTLENFKNLTIEQTTNIDGLGDVCSENKIKWLSNNDNKNLIDELMKIGLGKNIEETKITANKLNGLKIAFTGKLQKLTRNECKKVILENGGIPWDIKKEISLLLIGDGAKETKIEKAQKLGAKIITEDEFLNMIK